MNVFVEAHDDCLCHMTPLNLITSIKGSGVNCVTLSIENLVKEDRLRVEIVGP